jgi:hypothetical protein
MSQSYFTFLSQAINDLLTTRSAAIQATGLDIFRGLAIILIVWFGVKSALSAPQGHGGGFHFARFADLILMIAFGLGMLTYYSSPIPGVGYSFSDASSNSHSRCRAQYAGTTRCTATFILFFTENQTAFLIKIEQISGKVSFPLKGVQQHPQRDWFSGKCRYL